MRVFQIIVGLLLVGGCGGMVGAAELSFSNQTVAAGLNSSYQPMSGMHSFLAGGTVGDFDNDGYQDVFFPKGGMAPDQLFMNNGNGTFTNQAVSWGIAVAHRSTSGAVGDFNRDGWLDLFVTSFGPVSSNQAGAHRLYKNNGDGTFTNVAASAGVAFGSPTSADGWGATFGDYDLDGDLDLLVSGWQSNNGNRLFRNNGDETFTDVTNTVGTNALNPTSGFCGRFIDMNGDRYPEIVSIGDFATTRYFVNDTDGTFTHSTAGSGLNQTSTEMGMTAQDFDRDGDFDLFVTTISSNRLYRNNGNDTYTNIAPSAGVVNTLWAWGTVGCDFDHDQRIDLAVTTQSGAQFLLQNISADVTQSLQFADVATSVGFTSSVSGRGLANFDYDNDGDQDLIIFPRTGTMQLFRNDLTGDDCHWLRIALEDAGAPDLAPGGVGARIRVEAGGVSQYGRVDAGNNYLSQGELAAHFGLGAETTAAVVEVEWSNGAVTVLNDVPADQAIVISAPLPDPGFVRGDGNADGLINISDPILNLDYQFNGGAAPCLDALDTDDDGIIGLGDPLFGLSYQFQSGPAPSEPFPVCGADPTPDVGGDLGCEAFCP